MQARVSRCDSITTLSGPSTNQPKRLFTDARRLLLQAAYLTNRNEVVTSAETRSHKTAERQDAADIIVDSIAGSSELVPKTLRHQNINNGRR